MTELDAEDVRVGLSADTMERRALALIGRVHNDGYRVIWRGPNRAAEYEHGLPKVCERSTQPLPYGCWDEAGRTPYAVYGAERWCDACIAYAGLNGTLPRPEQQIELRSNRNGVAA